MTKTAEIRIVTKKLVDALLAMNTNNRNLKKRTVERYARDIAAGKWKLTNQGIGVSTSGVLIDGQHRLEAIKACGYPPIEILVVHGLDDDSQIAVDAHAKRSARDMLHFAFGYRVSRSAPAIGNIIIKVKKQDWGGGTTNAELLDCINEHYEEIDKITSIPKDGNFFAAPYLACFVLALNKNPDNEDRIVKFMKDVESGEMLNNEMPQYHLNKFILVSRSNKSGGNGQFDRFTRAEKALSAYLDGKKMKVLRGI